MGKLFDNLKNRQLIIRLLIASQNGKLRGKWWMPWDIEAMKDAA